MWRSSESCAELPTPSGKQILPSSLAVPRDPQRALRQQQGPHLTKGLNTGFLVLMWMGKTRPCFLANKLLETPGLFFSFPLSQVFAVSADGNVCTTCKDGDVLTFTTHVSLKQQKSLLCESYFSPAEGDLALIKTVGFFPSSCNCIEI